MTNYEAFNYLLEQVKKLDFEYNDMYKIFKHCSILLILAKDIDYIKDLIYYHKGDYGLMKRYDISAGLSVLGKELEEDGFEFEHIFVFILFVMLMNYTDFYELSFYNFVKLSKEDYWKFFDVDGGILVRVKQTGGLNYYD
jgi:hypothetical protein